MPGPSPPRGCASKRPCVPTCACGANARLEPYETRPAAYELGWKADYPDPYESLRKFSPRFK